jgi:hypothetical protein
MLNVSINRLVDLSASLRRFTHYVPLTVFDLRQVIADGTANAMKARIKQRGAVATGNLISHILVIPRGQFLTVSATAPYSGYIDSGVSPHVVRVDTRLNSFEPWARVRNLTNTKGPWFRRTKKGTALTTLSNKRGGTYLFVGGENSNIKKPGVQFVQAGMTYIERNVDKVIDKKLNELLSKLR